MKSINDTQANVGFAAGDIFRALEQGKAGDLNTLRGQLQHIDDPTFHQGIGWLLREGKVQLKTGPGNGSPSIQLRH